MTEIKSLIQLEGKKVVKKQKGEFDVTVLKLQERITTLELEKDHLEQYGRRVCVTIDNVPVESKETTDSLYEKVGEFFRVACPEPTNCRANLCSRKILTLYRYFCYEPAKFDNGCWSSSLTPFEMPPSSHIRQT